MPEHSGEADIHLGTKCHCLSAPLLTPAVVQGFRDPQQCSGNTASYKEMNFQMGNKLKRLRKAKDAVSKYSSAQSA